MICVSKYLYLCSMDVDIDAFDQLFFGSLAFIKLLGILYERNNICINELQFWWSYESLL